MGPTYSKVWKSKQAELTPRTCTVSSLMQIHRAVDLRLEVSTSSQVWVWCSCSERVTDGQTFYPCLASWHHTVKWKPWETSDIAKLSGFKTFMSNQMWILKEGGINTFVIFGIGQVGSFWMSTGLIYVLQSDAFEICHILWHLKIRTATIKKTVSSCFNSCNSLWKLQRPTTVLLTV